MIVIKIINLLSDYPDDLLIKSHSELDLTEKKLKVVVLIK